jgi:NAD(P)-dependent dehydrogenase (short-subunit alcohol dehydrogenase family)
LAQKLPGSLPLTVDMTQFDRVREAIGAVHKHYGRINGLVNNAGRSRAPAQQACVLSAPKRISVPSRPLYKDRPPGAVPGGLLCRK